MRIVVLTFSLLAALAAPAAFADPVNLVTNPDFAGGNLNYPGYGSVPGWTFQYDLSGSNDSTGPFVGGDTLPAGISTAGFIQAAYSPDEDYNYPGVNSAWTILSATLIPGQLYDFSFYFDARPTDPTDLNVTIGDTELAYFEAATATPDFTLVQGSFIADAGTGNTLAFADRTYGSDYSIDGTINITGVDVSMASTPEPSSLMLLGTGVLGLAGAVRRRFTKA